MKQLLALAFLAITASSMAQTLPTVSGTAMSPDEAATLAAGAAEVAQIAALTQAGIAAIPSGGRWSGKLDLTHDYTIGGWQSVRSLDEAFGLSKRVFHVDKGTQPLLNIGVFIGAQKQLLAAPSSPQKLVGGLTVAVPGSTLDWALGTNWGSKWAPWLKTGLLVAYDTTRFKDLTWNSAFIGIGATAGFYGIPIVNNPVAP